MTGTEALAGRAVIGMVGSVAGVAAVRSRRLVEMAEAPFERWAVWIFAASRLLLFALLFGVLRLEPRGDIPAYYMPEALGVLAHQVPYRDFVSSYAPLHMYMDSLPLRLWRSPLAIMLLAVCAETLVLPLWFRLGREFLPRAAVRTAALLYVTSPISMQYVTVDGQDNTIIAVLMGLAMLLLIGRRPVASGAALGLSVCLTKVIALLFAPVFFLATEWRARLRWAAAMLLPVGVVYGSFLLAGLPVFVPLKVESALRTTSNLPYLFEAVTGWTVPNGVWNGLTLLALTAVWAFVGLSARAVSERARARVIAFGAVAVAVALMMCSKKSWPAYLIMVLFPMYAMFADRNPRKLWTLAGFSVVVAVEHSAWSTLLGELPSVALHRRVLAGDPLGLLLLGLEVLLICGFGWLLLTALRLVRRAGRDAQGSIEAQAAG